MRNPAPVQRSAEWHRGRPSANRRPPTSGRYDRLVLALEELPPDGPWTSRLISAGRVFSEPETRRALEPLATKRDMQAATP
ncbi:MAG: hypothetical protein BGO98_35975 [Myxococcales bacterium 68-20]|nr:MAG: hypothetical protein BGO98_35975 [Myxococcales bacterium 68-20]